MKIESPDGNKSNAGLKMMNTERYVLKTKIYESIPTTHTVNLYDQLWNTYKTI